LLRKRFEREAEIAGRLEHPHIAAVHDFGITDDNRQFLVMAFVNGLSLSDLLIEEPILSWRRAVNLFKQVCEALKHAHEQGVLHRDIKPANIMVEGVGTSSERVKLVDFGIAKLKPLFNERIEKLTNQGDIFGTFEYMSPEQCLGKEPDERSDIYALGCVMYETLTGLPPIFGTNALEIIQKHLDFQPPTCREAQPQVDLPQKLDLMVCRCLAKDPADRYSTVADLLSELRQLA